jgi:hypothetical protein
MKSRAIATVAVALLICLMPITSQALNAYDQSFDGLNMGDTAALGNAGWLVFANVFGPDWAYWYGYGAYPAPNDGFAFCAIVDDQGGAAQGLQQMVVFSDYNNVDHANGAYIEANTFQEQIVGVGDVGETWEFFFDAKMGNLDGSSTALAFIKTLNPAAGWATTNFITADMTATAATWTGYSVSIYIDASLEGQILQFGFSNTATAYESSGVFYDNVVWGITGPVAVEASTWGGVKSLFR